MTMPSFHNITWERLEREGAVTYPVDGPDEPGNDIIFGDGIPDRKRPGEDRAGATSARPTRCRTWTTRWCSRPAGVLEHWHTGSMTRRAGRARRHRARGGRLPVPARARTARISSRAKPAPGDPARRDRAQGARGPRRAGRHGVHAVLLRGGCGEPAHESGARPDGQDSRVQVLRGPHLTREATRDGRAAGSGRIAARLRTSAAPRASRSPGRWAVRASR